MTTSPSPAATAVTTEAAPAATPAATTSTTTTTPAAATLVLDPVEALAASGGVAVTVTDAGGEVVGILSASVPRLAVQAGTLSFAYPAESVDPAPVTWSQPAAPGETVVVRQPWREDGSAAGDVVLVWQALGDRAAYRAGLDAAPGVTVTSPVWWFIRSDGSLGDDSDPGFVADAAARGVEVWPAVASLDADANHVAFGDPAVRAGLAAAIAERAEQVGAGGVNVDVEGFRAEDAPGVTAFVEDLAALVHAWGGTVSYDLIPRTDLWEVTPADLAFWSTAPQRRELAAAVDYLVVMAYDEFNRYRPAGPVASPRWTEEVLAYALRFADPHRVLLGVPFYGRVWDPDEPERPRAIGIGALEGLAATGVATPDPVFGLDRVDLPDGRYLWLETAEGLRDRLELVHRYGLAGWAAWRLGFDSPSLWDVLGG